MKINISKPNFTQNSLILRVKFVNSQNTSEVAASG